MEPSEEVVTQRVHREPLAHRMGEVIPNPQDSRVCRSGSEGEVGDNDFPSNGNHTHNFVIGLFTSFIPD